jgi:uncharacterized protein (TIGR02147 family)
MKPIQSYSDYRKFLLDHYRESKAGNPAFTFAAFARKAGLASPNYLKLVMDGDRSLTTANIHAFAKAMDLTGAELDLFESLVLENQAETPLAKRYYGRRLRELRRSRTQGVARKRSSSLLENGLRTAVLLCAQGKAFEEAARIAAEELRITPEKSESILRTLLSEGQLTLDEQGFLQLINQHTMVSDPKGMNDRQHRFLRGSLEEARQVFRERYPRDPAKFLSLLMTAPSGSLNGIFADLRSAAEKAAQDYDPPSNVAGGVYRVQFQVYRLRRSEE